MLDKIPVANKQFTVLKAPNAKILAFRSTAEALIQLQNAYSKLQTFWHRAGFTNSKDENGDVNLLFAATQQHINGIRRGLYSEDHISVDKIKKTFSSLNNTLLDRAEILHSKFIASAAGYNNANLQAVEKHLAFAKKELALVHELLLSFEKSKVAKPVNQIIPETNNTAVINLDRIVLESNNLAPLCSAERFSQYLKRNCPVVTFHSDFINFSNSTLNPADFVSILSRGLKERELSNKELDSLKAIFRFFNHEQRVQIGKYLCSLIRPDYQSEARSYLKGLENLAADLCKITGTANFSAQLIELISGHRFAKLGRSLQPMANNPLFSIQPNGAVVIQRIYDSSSTKSDSIAAVTSIGLLPLVIGKIKEEKWNLFCQKYYLEQIKQEAIALNGGVVEYYQLGLDSKGKKPPEAILCPLNSAIPAYLSIYISEAVRPIRRASY